VPPTRPPRLKQGSVTLHKNDHAVSHTPRTRWPISIGSALSHALHTRDNSQSSTCKNPATPCGYKRGGRAPITTQQQRQQHSRHKCSPPVVHSTPLTSQSRDLGLSPHSQPACILSQNRPNYKSSSVETINKQSSFQTWAHIIPVVNWNHEGFQTNSQQTKIVIVQHKHSKCYIVIHCRRSGTTSESLSYYNTCSK